MRCRARTFRAFGAIGEATPPRLSADRAEAGGKLGWWEIPNCCVRLSVCISMKKLGAWRASSVKNWDLTRLHPQTQRFNHQEWRFSTGFTVNYPLLSASNKPFFRCFTSSALCPMRIGSSSCQKLIISCSVVNPTANHPQVTRNGCYCYHPQMVHGIGFPTFDANSTPDPSREQVYECGVGINVVNPVMNGKLNVG